MHTHKLSYKKIYELYRDLLKKYGPQGWWPINNKYHPKDYSYPKTEKQRFEICIGAILTQNTSWMNVEKALLNLIKLRLIDPVKIRGIDDDTTDNILKDAIKSAGYFNQKAKKIKIFSEFYIRLKGRIPTRDELLDVWGIGPETADSILLYAYNRPEFVIDAYTKKLLLKMKIINKEAGYDEIKCLFEKNLPKKYTIYQEFHALIVENGKHRSTS